MYLIILKEMKRKILFTGLAAIAYQAITAQNAVPPNLLIILADQWRGQALGFLGIEPVITPNIDNMAKEGVVFTQAASAYPLSSPARAMLMTGMYPVSNKVTNNCNSNSEPFGVELQKNALCWSDVLSEKGYELGYIGKWHLDAPYRPYVNTFNNTETLAWNEWTPPEKRHGFSHWYAYGTYDRHLNPMYWSNDDSRNGFSYVDAWGPDHETDKAIEFLTNLKKRPFALVVSFNPPHNPYQYVPDKYKKMYDKIEIESLCKFPDIPPAGSEWGDYYRANIKDYYAAMTGIDNNIGRLIIFLKNKGLFDNTIVVFSSDHGNCLGIHGQVSKNNYYEESVRVPLVITYPEKLKPRIDNDLLISFEDLGPSLLSLMGFGNSIPASTETRNLAKGIKGSGSSPLYQPYMFYKPEDMKTGLRGVRTKQYTYVLSFTDGEVRNVFLFDRKSDPYQMKNIAGTDEQLENSLKKMTYEWMKKAKDPIIVNASGSSK